MYNADPSREAVDTIRLYRCLISQAKEIDPGKDLNWMIKNVVTSFRVRCHLNLRKIALEGINAIYQKELKVLRNCFVIDLLLALLMTRDLK